MGNDALYCVGVSPLVKDKEAIFLTDTDLHIGDKAAMDLMPYQLEPVQISLRRPRQRILIADTVGLGKTLEAGILMSKLIARGEGRRILVGSPF